MPITNDQIAIVTTINVRTGAFAVDIIGGDSAAFELLGTNAPAVGDTICGDVSALGGVTLTNRTQNESLHCCGQVQGCTPKRAKQAISRL